MSLSVQVQTSDSDNSLDQLLNNTTPCPLKKAKVNSSSDNSSHTYSLEVPYREHIQDIFKAAFANDPNRVDFLCTHPLFQKSIQAHVNPGEPRLLFHLMGLIQELPKEDLQKIVDRVLQFTKDNPQDSDLLSHTLMKILKHPSLEKSPFKEILPWIALLPQNPCSDHLSSMLFPTFWNHPSVQKASKAELFSCLDQIPSTHKIRLLIQIAQHPALKGTDLTGIKDLIQAFNTYYKENPCTEIPLLIFHSVLFGYASMSGARIEDLSSFFEGVSDPCRITLSSFVLQHQALMPSPENEFREGALDLLKSILLHPSVEQMPREEFFKSFIKLAKGLIRMQFIQMILSKESHHSFTLEEFKELCSLFLEELDPSDHLGLKEFSDAARSYLMRNRIDDFEIRSQLTPNRIIADILEEFNSRLENDAMDEARTW